MAIGSGIASQLVYKPESVFGVVPAALTATNEGLEFKNESLGMAKTTVQGQGLHGGSSSGGGAGLYDRAGRRVLTNYAASGGITMDLQTRFIGTLIQHMLGSFGQSAATPTQIGTTGMYKSVHNPGSLQGHSLCFQKGVPAVDGTVEPFTYVGCKITDWEISVATGALAQLVLSLDSRSELAGVNVLGNPAVPATNITVLNTNPNAVSVVISGGTLTAVKVNGVTVGTVAGTYIVPAGQTIAITYTVAPTWVWTAVPASGDPLNLTVPPLATFSTAGSGLPMSEFHFREATILTGGVPTESSGVVSLVGATAAANVTSASVKQAISCDTGRYFLGSAGFKAEQIENGFRQITGQLVVEWLSSEALYGAYASDVTTSLELTFTGPLNAGGQPYLLDIIIPNIKLDGEAPKVGGPNVVTQSVAFTGLDDEATTPIQITYQTEDSAL